MKKVIGVIVRISAAAAILFQTQMVTSIRAAAQNLVPNPSFELMNACPTGIGEGFPFPSGGSPSFAIDWFMPSIGTADYFNACAPNPPAFPMIPNSTPYQFDEYQVPRTGNAYAGGVLNWRHCEYIQARLSSPFIQGNRIYTSFWVNSRNSSCGGADQIGVYFSQNAVEMPNTSVLDMFTPQVETPPNVIYYDTLDWMKVSGSFIAAGNERWATFGFFKPWDELAKEILCTDGGFGIGNFYYYYDDVCVMDIDGPTPFTRTIDTNLCSNPTLTFTARAGDEYFWSDGSTDSQLTITQPGTYWVTSVNSDQCTFIRDTIKVTDASTTIPLNIQNDTAICNDKEIVLSAQHSNFSDYLWSTGATSSSISVNSPGKYWVKASADCALGIDTITVSASENCKKCLIFPNAFTPNNDGLNDLFKPSILCDVAGYKLDIYNRFGQLVFTSYDVNSGWNGQFNGKRADFGVYFFNAIFQNRNSSKSHTIVGDLSMIW